MNYAEVIQQFVIMSAKPSDEMENNKKAAKVAIEAIEQLSEIRQLIDDCEEYQKGYESIYRKRQEKVNVYDKIVDILKGGE